MDKKKAREDYEEQIIGASDISDGELDAAILTHPLSKSVTSVATITTATTTNSMTTLAQPFHPSAPIEGGLFEEDDRALLSSSSSEDDDEKSGGHYHKQAFDDDQGLQLNREELIRTRLATANNAMLPVLSSMTADQHHRYETFRRVGFPRPFIKKLITKAWSGAMSATTLANAMIVVAGIAKVFVGELVEEAREVADEWGDEASPGRPLLPSHYREAQRRLVNSGRIRPYGVSVRNCLL